MFRHFSLPVFALLLAVAPALAEERGHAPYAGQETRGIASLSDEDIAEIEAGQGWGLALPAELNGAPGPTHLLEMADDIGLAPSQIERLTGIRDGMRRDAILAGKRFLAAERALDAAFSNGVPEADDLRCLVTEAGAARAELRLVHLSAHLLTAPLLTVDQVAAYNRLRGYAWADDPCSAAPEGHDAAMWRQHNGCR